MSHGLLPPLAAPQHSQLTAETGIMHAADRLEHSPWHASGTRGHGFAVPGAGVGTGTNIKVNRRGRYQPCNH